MKFLYCYFILILCSCTLHKKRYSGYIIAERIFFNPTTQEYVKDNWPTQDYYLYLDSFIIYRRDMITIYNDHFTGEKIGTKLMYYCFRNMNSNANYEFDSLIVNPKCLKTYNTSEDYDSTKISINYIEKNHENGTPMIMENAIEKDTVIGKIKMRVFSLTKKLNANDGNGKSHIEEYYTTLRWYLRDDLTNPPLRLNRKIDEKYKLTIVRFDMQPDTSFRKKDQVYGAFCLNYEPKELTKYELHIFDAWIKYAKETPIKN